MNDGIIKNNGTSRLMRATLPATYEEFKRACESGTQPLDVLFNAAGWAQLPDFLNKGNLWADDMAALFGLGQDSVPDDGFKKVYDQNKVTEGKITRELIRKISDTPEKNNSVSFAIDLTDFDITKYKSGIISFDVYNSHNGGDLSISSIGTYFSTDTGRDQDSINLYMGYPDTAGSLVMVGSVELQFQFTKKVSNTGNLMLGIIKTLGKLSSPVNGFYGRNLETGVVNRTLTFTQECDGGKAAIKHIEVFGERYV